MTQLVLYPKDNLLIVARAEAFDEIAGMPVSAWASEPPVVVSPATRATTARKVFNVRH
jgi:hypothetical protein